MPYSDFLRAVVEMWTDQWEWRRGREKVFGHRAGRTILRAVGLPYASQDVQQQPWPVLLDASSTPPV